MSADKYPSILSIQMEANVSAVLATLYFLRGSLVLNPIYYFFFRIPHYFFLFLHTNNGSDFFVSFMAYICLPGVLKTGFPEILSRIQLIAGNLSGHNFLKAVTFLG